MAALKFGILGDLQYKDVDARLSTLIYSEPYWFPSFFPWKEWPFLTAKTIKGSKGSPVIADIIEYDASAPEKTRKKVDSISLEIPKTAIKRKMSETDLIALDAFKTMATQESHNSIIDLVFNDINFCMDGCHARLEWVVLQLLSNTTLELKESNNVGKVTETTIDYQMLATNKRLVKSATGTRAWNSGNSTQYTPVTDFRVVAEEARTLGFKVNFAIMNKTGFNYFVVADEVINLSAPYMGAGFLHTASFAPQPSIDAVNAMLATQDLPQIILVDTRVTIETHTHTQTNTDPWTDGYVTFIPERICGPMYAGPIMEEKYANDDKNRFKTDHVLLTQWSKTDPVSVITKAELNAWPSWDNIDECIRFSYSATPQSDGLDN